MASPLTREAPANGASTRKKKALRRLSRLAIILGGLYVLLLIFLYVEQRTLIFPAGRQNRAQAAALPAAIAGLTAPYDPLLLETPGHERTAALYAPALTLSGRIDPDAARRPTLLYFYGNGSSLPDSADVIEAMRRRGLNVMVSDYVGYGQSGGEVSEAGCYDTADAAYAYLTDQRKIAPGRIVIMGRSLGTAVAVDLASRKPSGGLITVSAFTTMADMAASQYPIVPGPIINVLLKHRFLSIRKIGRVHCPILLAHCRDDDLVPFSMASELQRAATAPVTRLNLPHGGHNFVFTQGGNKLYDQLGAFARKTAGQGAPNAS
jgi:fermentation-respiration switch protein FrsA (DUF1100 family)